MRCDVCNLKVNTSAFCGVSCSIRFFSPVIWPYFKHFFKASCHSHLLIKLWALCKVCFLSIIIKSENLCSTFTALTAYLWRMNFNEAFFNEIFTHGMLNKCSYLKNEAFFIFSKVQPAIIKLKLTSTFFINWKVFRFAFNYDFAWNNFHFAWSYMFSGHNKPFNSKHAPFKKT